MKVLFCQNGPIKKFDNEIYSISYNNKIFSRYNIIADEINVLTRVKNVKNISELGKSSKITLDNFDVIQVPDFLSVKNFAKKAQAKKIIYDAVKNTDYVVVRVPGQVSNYAIDAAKKYSKPYLVEVVGCAWDAYWNHSLAGKICAPYLTYAMKKRVKAAPISTYVTNEFLQRRYPTNGRSYFCSDVELKEFNDEVINSRISKIVNNSDKIYVLGTLAAIDVRYKGQQHIIRTLGKMKKSGITNFRYEIVGSGNPGYLMNEIEKNDVFDLVTIKGSLPHDEVFDWLDSIDIYIQPSKQEGLPRALVEAMSRGLPALGANTGGIPELIDKMWIFDNSCNPDEIISKLTELTSSDMSEVAKNNYENSKKYRTDALDEKRKQIFSDFKSGRF